MFENLHLVSASFWLHFLAPAFALHIFTSSRRCRMLSTCHAANAQPVHLSGRTTENWTFLPGRDTPLSAARQSHLFCITRGHLQQPHPTHRPPPPAPSPPVPCWVHCCSGGTCLRSWACCCWCSAWRGDSCCSATPCSSLDIKAAPSCASRSWSSAGDTSRSWRRRTRMHRAVPKELPWQVMVSSFNRDAPITQQVTRISQVLARA